MRKILHENFQIFLDKFRTVAVQDAVEEEEGRILDQLPTCACHQVRKVQPRIQASLIFNFC